MRVFHYFTVLTFIIFGSACAGLGNIATNVPTQTTEGGAGGGSSNPYDGSGLVDNGDNTEGSEETTDDGTSSDDGEEAMETTTDDGSDDTTETTDSTDTTDDGTTEVAVAETDDGGEENAPVVLLPAPTSESALPTNESECVYVGATDEEEELPIVAAAGCVYCLNMETGEVADCNPEDWMLVASDSELDTETAWVDMPKGKTPVPTYVEGHLAPTMLARVMNWFLPFGNFIEGQTHRSAPTGTLFGVANAEDSDGLEPTICAEEGVTCCNIAPNASFECFHQRSSDNREDTVYLYYVKKNPDEDDDGVIDEEAETLGEGSVEDPNQDIIYTAQSAIDSTLGDSSNVYGLSKTRALEFKNDGRWFVKGNHTENYQLFESSAIKLVYDPDNVVFSLTGKTTGMSLFSEADGEMGTREIDDAIEYTDTKMTDEGPFFGVEVSTATDEAYLYSVYEGIPTYDTSAGRATSDIQFMSSSDGLTFTKTLLFAQNEDGYFLVLYMDDEGKYHLRMSNGTTMFGGDIALKSSFSKYNFTEMQFITNKKALLLDAENNMVWIVKADSDTLTVDSLLDKGLSITKPVDMAITTDKSKVYILSADDNKITAIGSRSGKPAILGEVDLKEDVFKKPLPFSPKTITLDEESETILVGCDDIKSTLLVDISELALLQ